MTDEEDTKIELSLANIEYDLRQIAEWLGASMDGRTSLDEARREQTAATILAALLPVAVAANPAQPVEGIVARAVVLTDALRAELAKVPR